MRRWTSPTLELPEREPQETYTRADLVFYGIDHSGPSYEGRVFLDNPEATMETARTSQAGYAGSFVVFGHGGCFGDEDHCHVVRRPVDAYDLRPPHPLEPWTMTVIVTEALQAIAGETFTVTVVPVVAEEAHPEGSDVLTVDHVRVATYTE